MEKSIEYFKGMTDADIGTLKKDIAEIKRDVSEMNASVRKMENWKNKVIGMALSLSLVVSIASSWVLNYFKS